jgi:hypothetical protein
MRPTIWTWICPALYMRSTRRPSICVCRCFWARSRSTKAAVKMHTLLRGNIPSFIHISNRKLHDVNALDMLLPEPGVIYVMDRGYVDFARLRVLHEVGAFFVARAKSDFGAKIIPEGDAELPAGLGEPEECVAADVGVGPAADVALGHLATDVVFRAIGVQRNVRVIEHHQRFAFVSVQLLQQTVKGDEACTP